MSIITKTGDKGQTSLLSGERVSKHHVRVESFGTIDELNSILGVIRSMDGDDFLDGDESASLKQIQDDLFDLGALLASTKSSGDFSKNLKQLETWCESLEAKVPALTNFVLPGGHPLAAQSHLARTVCRRAEREMIKIENLPAGALPYINRLSDFLYLLARFFNQKTKTDEVIWKK